MRGQTSHTTSLLHLSSQWSRVTALRRHSCPIARTHDMTLKYQNSCRTGGAGFGLPPTNKALDAYLEMLEGTDLPWAVAVIGGDVLETGLAQRAIDMGGHVRVNSRRDSAKGTRGARASGARQSRRRLDGKERGRRR